MINGFSHTSTDTTALSDSAVASSPQGFNKKMSSSSTSKNFASTYSEQMSAKSSPEENQSAIAVSLLNDTAVDTAASNLTSTVASNVVDFNSAASASTVTDALASAVSNNVVGFNSATSASTVTDSLVSAVSNAVSTTATLATAQVATNQLATNSLLDSKLIEVSAVKDSSAATETLLNGTVQASSSETSSNLQFKATLDKILSAQELGERLSSTIADKVTVQVNAKTPTATIRLDPPDLGKIDLVVKLDNDKLNIQINASSSATRESIQATSERLRAELVEQNFLHVDVYISGEHQSSPEDEFFMSEDDFVIASNSVSTTSETEQQIDNSELARA